MSAIYVLIDFFTLKVWKLKSVIFEQSMIVFFKFKNDGGRILGEA
jgi:hypothetical protein